MAPPTAMAVFRNLAIRPRAPFRAAFVLRSTQPRRSFADNSNKSNVLPKAAPGETGPNMDTQEHVSEEAAKMAEITGGEGPDLSQGTPVQEILKEEASTRKSAPQVMKDATKSDSKGTPSGSRSFSTMSRRPQQDQLFSNSDAASLDPSMLPSTTQIASFSAAAAEPPTFVGHTYPLPATPLPPNSGLRARQDPVVTQFTSLLMQHGKKATAQRNAAVILTHLRTTSAPTYSATRPLLPGAPPASHLPLHPTLYLQLAIDSLAPLLRIKAIRGAAGGGQSLQVPMPLGLRQRRRTAMMWIIDAASKRKSTGSGKNMFALKVAAEIVSVVEGKSSLWDKRAAVHKLGTTARVNLMAKPRGRR